ncbi:hypothetical protein FVE85_9677 [Porphyridium purpureum]|uniref:Uncharacterized protein n=1 Tax=Porphyridium purpureum TaxID=35688 RepID=A0A5J4YL69_PORPP|nr:hypothetical protein FVE85_9677 [Porphyridium purpureum]|eukprot:POR6472..scf246_12
MTGFATADQLAFDMMERLISQDSERGIFSVVDMATGANGELGVEGVDFVRLFEMGMLRTFADLASSLDCDARTPIPTPTPLLTPTPTPTPEFCCSPHDEGAVCDVVPHIPEESSDSDDESQRLLPSTRHHRSHGRSRGRGHGHGCHSSSSSDSEAESTEMPCCPCICPRPPPTAPVCGNVGSDSSGKSGKSGSSGSDSESKGSGSDSE